MGTNQFVGEQSIRLKMCISCSFVAQTCNVFVHYFTNGILLGKVYWIQHYVIKMVSDLRQIGVFSGYSGFLHNKPYLHDIAKILLKVALAP